MNKLLAPIGLGALLALGALAQDRALTGRSAVPTFQNPILDRGQDPSAVFDGARYHLVQSDSDGISVRTSLTLTGLGTAKKVVVWQGGRGDTPCCNLWAPELVRLGGKWYIYYAADDGRNENHRMYVLESQGTNPAGPYVSRGQITDPTNKWAIDGTVLALPNGQNYFVWSGWEGDVNVQQDLYIARLKNPWTIEGTRARISRPDQPWERIGQPYINEGPQPLVRGKDAFIVYSASGSWTDDYCLGTLRLTGRDPMQASSWKKSNGCVFSRDDAAEVFAPGHGSFVPSPDGSEDWQLYHAIEQRGASWGGRSVRVQEFSWGEDGAPRFGRPSSFDAPLTRPSGEYEAEEASGEGARPRIELFASNGEVVRMDGRDRLSFTVRAPRAGSYTARLRFASAGEAARLDVTAGGAKRPVSFSGARGAYGTVEVPVTLQAGESRLDLAVTSGAVDLDALTLTPRGR